MYCVYQGKARQTVTPATSSVTNAMLAGSTGHKTIGTGALPQDQNGARQMIESIGANFDDIYSGKKCLTQSQVNWYILENYWF